MCQMPPCWFLGCRNPVSQPTKCDPSKEEPCSGWQNKIGDPVQDVFCDEHASFKPITPAIHGPKYFKHPNPDLGAHTNFQAPYDDAGNSGQFQFYSASKFPESLSNQPGTTTDYPVRDSPYSSLLTPDGKIHTHSIPGGIHATGPIPDPLPPYYVDEDMTSNNPYASSNPNAVPPAAASLAGPHHSSHSRSRQYAGVDKQARHKSKSSKSHGHR